MITQSIQGTVTALSWGKDEFVMVRKDRNAIILYLSKIALKCFIGFLMSRNKSRLRALEADCPSPPPTLNLAAFVKSPHTDVTFLSPSNGPSPPASDERTVLQLESVLLHETRTACNRSHGKLVTRPAPYLTGF